MSRTRALALLALALLGVGTWRITRRASPAPSLSCPPEDVHWRDAGAGMLGFAACGPGAPLPAAWARTVGQKLNLNAVAQGDLAEVPGVGPHLAEALVRARDSRHGFKSWDDVDAVKGVGPAKLRRLQEVLVLGP